MSELRQRANPKESSQTPKEEEKRKKNYYDPIIFSCILLRMIAGMTFLLSTIWILWLVLPIRLLNPLFRKLGIPNNALPADLAPKFWDRIFLRIMGFSVSIEGTEKCTKKSSFDSHVFSCKWT